MTRREAIKRLRAEYNKLRRECISKAFQGGASPEKVERFEQLYWFFAFEDKGLLKRKSK